MADLSHINRRIGQCQASADAIECVTQLFEETRDGHVAMALGDCYKRLGKVDQARQWYLDALI